MGDDLGVHGKYLGACSVGQGNRPSPAVRKDDLGRAHAAVLPEDILVLMITVHDLDSIDATAPRKINDYPFTNAMSVHPFHPRRQEIPIEEIPRTIGIAKL